MARRNYKQIEVGDIVGGIDYDSSPFDVPEDCLISSSNVLPSLLVGAISVRNGIQKFNSVAISEAGAGKAIVGLVSLYSFGGITEYFVAQAGTKLYNNTPEGTWADITGTLVFTDSANNLTSFAILNNVLYGANRSNDQLFKWTLTGNATAITDPPSGKPKILIMFNRRIFCFGNTATPVIGDYSDIDDGSAYTAGNFLNFDEGQGSSVVGAVKGQFGQMIVFKQKSIHIVEATGTTPPFTKYLFVDGIGCVSHQSLVTLPGGTIMWWDTDDIYIMNGNVISSATNHPKTKKPRLRNFFRNNVNQSRLQYVVGVYYPLLDIVRFFYSTAGSNKNNAHIDFHVKTRSFWPGTLRGTSACIRVISGQPRIMAGDTTGFSYRQDYQTNDDGSSISWNAQIPWQAPSGVTVRNKADLVYAVIDKQSNYDVLCDVFLDQSQTATIVNGVLSTSTLSGAQWDVAMFDQNNWPNEASILEASLAVNRLFKTISVNFHADSLDQPVDIFSSLITYRPLEFTRATT